MPKVLGGVEFFSVDEAAALKGVSRSTIVKAAAEGRIGADKVGRDWLFTGSSIEAYHPGSYGGVERHLVRRGPGRTAGSEKIG